MMTQNQQTTAPTPQKPSKPNEQGSIAVMGFVRIYDPKTKQSYVETRA